MSNTYCSTHHEITAPPGLIELAPGYPSINIVTPQLERKDFCSLLSNTDHTCTYMLCNPHVCVCVCIYRHILRLNLLWVSQSANAVLNFCSLALILWAKLCPCAYKAICVLSKIFLKPQIVADI